MVVNYLILNLDISVMECQGMFGPSFGIMVS